jgi:SAM-dependent methyltransferase
VTVDYYAGAGRRWLRAAELVYGPFARELLDMSPHPLQGRTVLDAGAGTGVASVALAEWGAHPVAMDLSLDMLSQLATPAPPCFVADIYSVPIANRSVDDAFASFVLNHLMDPVAGLAELVRVVRPGGALLAAVYSAASRSAVRDRVDAVAVEAGWQVPDWYIELKATAVPLLWSASAMRAAAGAAGLVSVVVDERSVDVGVVEPEQLVDYRFGQAHYASWLDQIGPRRAEEIRCRAIETIRPIMEPYRPTVVFLSGLVTRPPG